MKLTTYPVLTVAAVCGVLTCPAFGQQPAVFASGLLNPAKIIVKRRVNGREMVMQVNGKALAGNTAAQPFEVLPGDTITVSESIF